MSYQAMLAELARDQRASELAPDRVPHTMLYGFVDRRIVGRVSIRHALNDRLRRRGGHLGYAVAEQYRRQGHGTELFRAGLARCRDLGLSRVLITCAESNVVSRHMIEKAGGEEFQRTRDESEDISICHFWVAL